MALLGCVLALVEPPPSPVEWVKYDETAHEINIQFEAYPGAVNYEIIYRDTSNNPVSISQAASAGGVAAIPCANGQDGSPLDISMKADDASGDWTDESAPVTMLCADVPASPASPTLLLSALDLILLEWDPPLSDGGSPILGYTVWMKASADTEFTLAYNGT
jgi:hypothetical protein